MTLHRKQIFVNNFKINLEINECDNSLNKDTLIFIHGFTGSTEEWKEIVDIIGSKLNLVLIDLPGFGKSDVPNDILFYTQDYLVILLKEIIEKLISQRQIQNPVLVGYSMGGRLALSFAIQYSNLLRGLILESASPGIFIQNERNKRIESDNQLIEIIKSTTIEEFLDYWMNQEIFKTQKKLHDEKLKQIREIKIKNNNKIGLINSLLGFGTGQMKPLWNDLYKINCHTLLITGELDEKFESINRRMNELIQCSFHSIIKNVGHNVHLEKPNDFVNLIFNFLKFNK